MAEAAAPEAAAQAQQPAAARPKYNPKPVALGWKDVVRYLEELWHEATVAKIDAPLDVLALAAASIKTGEPATGKVVTIDATLPNLIPFASSRPRVVERILSLCGRLLEQTEEGIDSKVYDAAGTIAVDLYGCSDRALRSSLRGHLYTNVLSSFKYCVDEVKSLGPHVRLAICNVINELDDLEASASASTFVLGSVPSFSALTGLVSDITQYKAEKSSLLVKMKILLDAGCAVSDAFAERACSATLTLLQGFNELTVSLVHATLDFFTSAVCRETDLDYVKAAVRLCVTCADGWTDAVRAQILFKLIELCRVAMCADIGIEALSKLIEQDTNTILSILCRPSKQKISSSDEDNADPYNNWMSGIAARAVECVSLSIERDCPAGLEIMVSSLAKKISNLSSACSENFTNVVHHERLLRRSLEVVNAILNSAHAADLFQTAFDDVEFFVSTSFTVHKLQNEPEIYGKSLELAALFIRQKSDAKVFTVFMREHMVNSFQVPNKWETKDPESRKSMIVEVLTLGHLCVQNRNVNRYKYFVWFMPPIYEMINAIKTGADAPSSVLLEEVAQVENSDVDLVQVLKEILAICLTALKGGSDIDLLLRDGVPMILQLYSHHSVRDVASMLRHIVAKFETGGSFFLLLELKFAIDIAIDKFISIDVTTKAHIEELFRALIQRGQREYIRGIIRVCTNEFSSVRYRVVARHLFSWLKYGRGMRELSDLCNICTQMFSLFKNPNPSVTKIASSVLQLLERYLEQDQAQVKDQILDVQTKLSRVLLIRNLFPQDFEQVQDREPEEVLKIFEVKFPDDVAQDVGMMKILAEVSERIEALEVDSCRLNRRFVTQSTLKTLNLFFEPVSDEERSQAGSVLAARKQRVENYVATHPKFVEIKNHLLGQGYDESLWAKDISIRVEIDDKKNIEENFKSALIGLYGEYIDMVKMLYSNIQNVQLSGGREVPISKLFAEDHRTSLSLEDLRSRRNIVIKMIDKQIKDHARKTYLQNRKLSLLAREDQLEEDLETQRQKEKLEATQKRQYWCRMNMKYFPVLTTCGKQIVGCYAPNGDHSEKVLENALKPNTAFVSLYEEDPDRKGQPGVELENIEVIFTDQGLYLYKLYSNGHPYDTSLVWVQFLKSILAANLVPSVIVPAQFPNSRVFNFLESFVAPEISGRILTVRDDYFEEAGVESYYDFKVEKVKQGDIILETSIVEQLQLPDMSFRDVLRTSSGRTRLKSSTGIEPAAQPQQPRANKPAAKVQIEQDLVGRLLTSVMKSLKAEIADEQKHPGMQGLSFLVEGTARFLSSFVNKYVEEGILDPVILSTGFDLDQWNRKKKGKNNRAVLTESHRDELVKMMFSLVRAEMSLLRKSETMREMFQNPARRNNCFDLQSHLQKVMVRSSRKYSSESAAIHQAGPPGPQGLRNANRGAAPQTSSAQTSDTAKAATAAQREQAEKDALALAALLNLEEVKQADCLEAMEAWVALNDIMKTCMTTVLLENVDRKPQEQLIKWIFGNEDRVWRDRGGRPGEETLDTFLAFVRPFDQQAIAQPANPPAASGSQSSQPPAAPSSSEPKVEEEDADRTSFAPNHYGQSPFGGFVALATEKLEHVKEISPVQAGAEVVAYCIGDYVAADNFEVVTAWVHPRYRGFGVAVDLYLRTMSEIERRGGRYMTFDVLHNSFERMVRSSVIATLLMKWNWSRSLILKKRKLSYDNETSAGTVEQFEKICIDVRWGLWAHRTYVRLSGLWHSIHRSIFFWQYKRENALRRATARFTSKIEELQE